MTQIAAEELGLGLDQGRSRRSATRHAGPYAVLSLRARRHLPSMGPAVRAAAADAGRQILEIAAQRYQLEQRGAVAPRRSGRLGGRRLLADRRGRRTARGRPGSSAEGGRGPTRPACRCSRSASSSPRWRRRRDGRGPRGADRRGPRRRPRDQPAAASSQVKGGVIQGVGPTLRGAAPRPGDGSDPDPDASTPTRCRPSPMSPRSSPSCWTSRTSI